MRGRSACAQLDKGRHGRAALGGGDRRGDLGLAVHAERGAESREVRIEVQVHGGGRLHATGLGDGLVVRQIGQQHVTCSREGVGVLRDKDRTAQQRAVGRDLDATRRSCPWAGRSGSCPASA